MCGESSEDGGQKQASAAKVRKYAGEAGFGSPRTPISREISVRRLVLSRPAPSSAGQLPPTAMTPESVHVVTC